MTGPEHYRRAEECLDAALQQTAGSADETYNLLAAQAHATLALTAVTALRMTDLAQWLEVAGPPPPEDDRWDYDRPDPEEPGPGPAVNGFAIGREP